MATITSTGNKMKMEKYVNYTSSPMLNIDDSNSLGYLNKVYQ